MVNFILPRIPEPDGLESRVKARAVDADESVPLRSFKAIKRRADGQGITVQEQIMRDRLQLRLSTYPLILS